MADIIDLDADPFVPKGWQVEEHRKGGQCTWDTAKVALYLAKRQRDGNWLEGYSLRDELRGKSPFNSNLMDYLLKHPVLIPEEWKGKYVFFWGTIYSNSVGDLYIRCLYLRDDRWGWSSNWLNYDWYDDGPAVIPAT